MQILVKSKLQKTAVYDVYWKFAFERQNVYLNRLLGKHPPWTNDPIIEKYKFTNSYRALDRVSQYLIDKIIRQDAVSQRSVDDRIFRILLFKLFNKVETWQLLERSLGDISWEQYSYSEYEQVLTQALRRRESIYSAAYIMASGIGSFGHQRKHQNHLRLLETMIKSGFARQVHQARSMAQVCDLLISYPLIGPFLSYQFATDINYSDLTDFSEEEFVRAGPGSVDGIVKCFRDIGHYTFEDVIHCMMDIQEKEFERLGLEFQGLFGRPLQLIDCQNLFCEVGKYARITHPHVRDKSGRKRIKQVFRGTGSLPSPSFPEKWNLSASVRDFFKQHNGSA